MSRVRFHVNRLLIGCAALLLSSCHMYEDVVVHEVQGIELAEANGYALNLRVLLDIENPNWYSVRLTESEVKIFLEGKALGDLKLLETMELPRRTRSVQSLYLEVSATQMEQILGDIFTLLFKQEYAITGLGYVKGKALFAARKVDVSFQETLQRSDLGF